MARNKVQFQKGVSLNDFIKQYGTEDKCFDALYAWRWPKGFQCPECGHDKCCQLSSRKLQQCNRCHRQTSVTAGTIFESTKLPLTLWFQGIYLITQDKKGISAMKLHRHLGISYNAAWRMKHKLMQVMMERDYHKKLSGFIELDDAYLGGERTGCKPGRGAAGKTPFVAAVETTGEHCPVRIKLSVVKGFRTEEIKSWSQQHLTEGSTVISDGLACFNAVVDAGCLHDKIVCGRLIPVSYTALEGPGAGNQSRAPPNAGAPADPSPPDPLSHPLPPPRERGHPRTPSEGETSLFSTSAL